MAFPTLLATIVILILFIAMFWQDIKGLQFTAQLEQHILNPLTKAERNAFVIMAVVVLLWMTEAWHGIAAPYVALAGTLSMLGARLINTADIKGLNWGLLVFLTAAFAIGKVMQNTGLTASLQNWVAQSVQVANTWSFYALIITIVMLVHMFLGSCVTTLSVAVPTVIALSEGVIPPLVIVFIAYFTVAVHYLLPYHQVTIIIGAGEDYFSNAQVLRYGLVMTIAVYVIIFFIYLPWWRWLGLLN